MAPEGHPLTGRAASGLCETLRRRPHRDVFVANADGTLEAAVVEHPADDYPIAWANAGNSSCSPAIGRAARICGPCQWPAGLRRGFRSESDVISDLSGRLGLTREGALYYAVNFSMTDVFTVALDPAVRAYRWQARRRWRRASAGNNSGPDLSPDGQEIVYQVGLPGTGIDLVFQSLQRNDERVVHPKLQRFSRPRFDPREQAVVVHGTSPDGTQGIFRVDRASGDVTVLASSATGGPREPRVVARRSNALL